MGLPLAPHLQPHKAVPLPEGRKETRAKVKVRASAGTSLTEIASIVESNDAKILSSYIVSQPNSKKIEITLKINRQDIHSIIKDFERHELESNYIAI